MARLILQYLLRAFVVIFVVKLYFPFFHDYLLYVTISKLFLVIGGIGLILRGRMLTVFRVKQASLLVFTAIVLLLLCSFQRCLQGTDLDFILGVVFMSIMLDIFIVTNDYAGLRLIFVSVLIALTFTCITTIIGLNEDPLACRISMDPNSNTEQWSMYMQITSRYRSLNIGDFNFIHACAILLPVIVWLSKCEWHNGRKTISFLYLGLSGLLYITILMSAFMSATISSTVLSIIVCSAKKFSFKILTCFLSLYVCILSLSSDLLLYIGHFFESDSLVQRKLLEIQTFITSAEGTGGLGYRLELYDLSFRSFLNSPLIGMGNEAQIGGHATWIDFLGTYGFFILLCLFGLFYYHTVFVLKRINPNHKFVFIVCFLNFVTLGFLKSINSIHILFAILFLVPLGLLQFDHGAHEEVKQRRL